MSIKELINKITEKSLVLRNPRMDNSNYDEALQFITSRELRELVRCCNSEYRRFKSLERQLEKREDDYRKLRERSDEQLAEKDRKLKEALKLAEEAIQHYEEADLYSEQFYYDVSVMLREALKEHLKEKGE